MAVRNFDGADDEIRVPITANLTGPYTIAFLVKRGAVGAWHALLAGHDNTGALAWEFGFQGSGAANRLILYNSGDAAQSTSTITSTTTWYIIVFTCDGTVGGNGTFHWFPIGGAWTHEAGVIYGADPLSTLSLLSGGFFAFGTAGGADDLNARIATAALWEAQLTNPQVEALATNLATADWLEHAVEPVAVWDFNQATATEDIPDLTGTHATITGTISGAADTNGITGTSVVTGADPPGWVFGAGGGGSVPVNTVAPVVTGTAETGQTVSCSTGTWSNTPTNYAYQWKRAGSNISGATSSTYVLQVADEGVAVKCTVTASNANGDGTPVDSNTITPSEGDPVNITPPSLSGIAETGETITCDPGVWVPEPEDGYNFAWKRNGSLITGGSADTYVLQVADEGQSIKCTVSWVDGANVFDPIDSNTIVPTAPEGGGGGGITLIRNHASTGNANPQIIPLTGKTSNKDLFVLFAVAATPTLPSPWEELYSFLYAGGAGYIKLWHLAAADNDSGVTQLSIALNGSRALSAVVWEDTLDTGTTVYCTLNSDDEPTNATPSVWGTDLHTFTERNETFGVFMLVNAATTAVAGDLVSYDQSYTDWADSGSGVGTEPPRIWMARKADTAMSNNGVTATADSNLIANNSPSLKGTTGMLAYASTAPIGNAPVNTVAPAITGVPDPDEELTCSTGTWTGDATITYAYQWKRNNVDISGETGNTYTILAGDVGDDLKCSVTATNSVGSDFADSNTVTVSGLAGKLSIAEENALDPDITGPEMEISGAGDITSLGFCREFSLNVGETANFAVDGDAVEIDIVRVGYYGGIGYRLVDTIVNTPVEQADPTTIANSNGGNTCSAWTDTAEWEIPDNATPGYYLGVVRSVPGPNASFIPFMVRDDDRPADIMVKASDTTWALAYNYFNTPGSPLNGKSFYGSTGPMQGGITNRAHVTTYHKPIVTRDGIPQTFPLYTEFPLVRYLERMGFDVNYSASKDWREGVDAPTLADCQIYISHGHDEYWSQGMRDKWEALRDAGKHLLFMTGNDVFWRTRFTDSGDRMWCFKDTMDGPGAHNAGDALDPVSWTGTWKDTRPDNDATRDPEWTLTGTDFRMNGVNYRTMVIEDGSPESQTDFWRNTDVETNGLSVADVIGMEADELRPLQPTGSYVVLASTTVNIDNNRADDNGENYNEDGDLAWGIVSQRYASGAVVIGFGTVTWSWGLDNDHDVTGAALATRANSRQQQAIYNLLRDLGASAPGTPIAGLIDPTPVSLDQYGLIPGESGGDGEADLFVRVLGDWVPVDKQTRVSGAWV